LVLVLSAVFSFDASRFFSNAGATRMTSVPCFDEQGKQYRRMSFMRGRDGASKPWPQVVHFHLTCFVVLVCSILGL
jgi:hypothetical protein